MSFFKQPKYRKKSNRIIVRLPNWIGDAVMSTPFLHALREVFPDAHITALGRPWVADLLANFPAIDELWSYDDKRQRFASLALISRLRRAQFDSGFLLTNSFGTALLFFAGKIHKRIGYARDHRTLLLTDAVKATAEILTAPMVEYYINLLSGFTDLSKHRRILKLYPTDTERAEVGRILSDNGWIEGHTLIGINPFAFRWSSKRWLPERFAEVAERLSERYKVQCVFVGIASDRPIFEEVQSNCKVPLIDLVGKVPLRTTPALLESYRLFVTNDSGLMHVAAAVGTPIVAIFGSTDWRTTAPYTRQATIVRKETPCAPCMKPHCPRNHECITKISVEDVLNAAAHYL